MAFSSIPNLNPVCEGQDDKSIVDLVPIEKVKSVDGVAEQVDSTDGGSGLVCHNGDMVGPVELVVKLDAEVL